MTSPGITAPPGEVKALVKGIAALNALADAPEGLALGEIAARTGLNKATAHRMLGTLTAARLVQALGDGRYRLGPHCLHLADAFLSGLDIRAVALPRLHDLAATTRETCHLGVRSGTDVVYLERIDSPQPVRMYSRLGATSPATTTGLGRAMLAFSSPETVDAVLGAGIPARTPRTVTDPAVARERLAAVRAHGYALDDVENETGIRCVAAPVLGRDGEAVAAISVAAPEHRLTAADVEHVGALVRAAAESISRELGLDGAFPGAAAPGRG